MVGRQLRIKQQDEVGVILVGGVMSKTSPWILGISSSHNASVCLLKGEEIVVAIQEERLTRFKRHKTFGSQRTAALEYCLDYAAIKPADVEAVVHVGTTNNAKQNVRNNPYLNVLEWGIQVLEIPHHFAHAISAFATSGFEQSAVLVVDGLGSPSSDFLDAEKACCIDRVENGSETISLYAASDDGLVPLEKHVAEKGCLIRKPVGMPRFRSLGGIFSSCAWQMFGDVNEAGKVMGLAPFGEQEFAEQDFFDIESGCFRFWDKVPECFEYDDRWPRRQKEYRNLAASAQVALESAILYLVSHLYEMCPSENLCYAGGVALNSVANERIVRESRFRNLYVVPAAEDSGPAIGAAYYGLWQVTGKKGRRKLIHDAMGRPYTGSEIIKAIERAPSIRVVDTEDVLSEAVNLLCDQKIIGWFQGRSELGPRALGQRSIICDPRRPEAKEILNARVKHREAFRPFAPAVLREEGRNWFDFGETSDESPYMLRVCPLKPGRAEQVPAIVHVDGTGRVQTLTREANGRFYELVLTFFERTGVPMVLNTSFNMMGEPIVETPEDALLCLMSAGLDYCVLGDKLVTKKRELEFNSVSTLLIEVAAIKDRVGAWKKESGRGDSPWEQSDNETRLREGMEEIHNANVRGIAAFVNEVKEHLGTVSADMEPENAVRPISDMMSREAWQALEEGTRSHLRAAGMINSLFMRYGGRRDWVCAMVEIFEAIQEEMQAKLVRPFLKWELSRGYVEGDDRASRGAGRVREGVGDGNEMTVRLTEDGSEGATQAPPDDSLRAFQKLLDGENRNVRLVDDGDLLVNQFDEFKTLFEEPAEKDFLEKLPLRMKHVVATMDNALSGSPASREDAVKLALASLFFLKHLPLIVTPLRRISQTAAETNKLLGSISQEPLRRLATAEPLGLLND
jgi:carbamoyltransferase